MKPEALSALKKEIEHNFGRKVTSYRDCIQLVEDIYHKTDLNVNVNTIRRFFGLVKTNYAPSHSTLAIFSKYCGFNSIDELENISLAPDSEKAINKEEVYHYLVSLFKNIPVSEVYVPVMEPIVQQTVIFLERNPSLIDRFQREIANTPGGQYYYYEICVNMDQLNGYYGNGLKYYAKAKNTNEAKIFSYSLQVFKYWLNDNLELVDKSMRELNIVPISLNYPPHILARYSAARLFYSNIKGEASDKILSDIGRYYSFINSKDESVAFNFDLIICEALILTNHITEGSEFIRRGKSKLLISPNEMNLENYPLSIWENLINQKKNKMSQIISTLPKKGNGNYSLPSILNKRYLKLLGLIADQKMRRNMSELLTETGFTRLSVLITN